MNLSLEKGSMDFFLIVKRHIKITQLWIQKEFQPI